MREKQKSLLVRIRDKGRPVAHDEDWLDAYCDDGTPDTFNMCHELGWLESKHNQDYGVSHVMLTEAGRTAINSHQLKETMAMPAHGNPSIGLGWLASWIVAIALLATIAAIATALYARMP